ncbi:MAG: PAC2 family protein [Candidatus Tectomicrobia bacterium]|uniref:PAC2 family protein n=1 Tax=Tectimicrobiota bacterium TaxID=2528274 RepID=A0A932HYM0_UNCTE|nr:PAC2 family protein [Candidatus Tectomicrobia bacterium]
MDAVYLRHPSVLRDPIMIMTFAGWNDAAESATLAARYLVDRLGGERFAAIPPDDFFQFSDQRPTVRLDEKGERQISWPANDFFVCRAGHLPRDFVVGVGVEPHLQWRRFSRSVLDIVNRCGVRLVVTMGAFLAGESHTEPVPVTCLATDPSLVRNLGMELSRYEGPTGIVGVLHSLMQEERLASVSLWASVPHYIAALPNPKASFALLDRLRAVCRIPLDLGDLERSAANFDRQVEEAIREDPKLARYVSQMEGSEAEDEPEEEEEHSSGEAAEELPPGEQVADEIADEIEDFLRRRKNGSDKD